MAANDAAAQSVAGTWRVVASHVASGGALSPEQAAAYEGRDVHLETDEVVGVLGNRCPLPRYATASLAPGDGFFDTGLTPEDLGYSHDQIAVVTVTCGAEEDPFDHFVRLGDDTLLTGFSGAVFALEPFEVPAVPPPESIAAAPGAATPQAAAPAPAEAEPSPSATERQEAPPVEGATASAPPQPTGPQDARARNTPIGPEESVQERAGRLSGPGAHVASYRSDADAQQGWQVLSRSFPQLASLAPVIVDADLGDRGMFRRLIGIGTDQQSVEEVCGALNRNTPSSCRVVTVAVADGPRAIPGTSVPNRSVDRPSAAPTPPADPAPAEGSPNDTPTGAQAAPQPAGLEASADTLTGVWGINVAEACDGGETIAFYPEGTVSLFGSMDGTWSLDGSQVNMVLTSYDESGEPTRRDIDAVLTLDLLQSALFVGALTANDRTARITGHACPSPG